MPKLLLSTFVPSTNEVAFRSTCPAESQRLKGFVDYSLASSFTDIHTHVKQSEASLSSSLQVTSQIVKKFEGAHWKRVLDNSADLLQQTFTMEASRALRVSPEQIRDVAFRLGSLYVTFHVTHDDDVSQEEISQRIEEHPFNEMWRLYNQFDGATVDLEALGQLIKGLEEKLTQKDLELEHTRKMNEQNTCELAREIEALRSRLDEVEVRERNSVKELEKEREGRKASEAQLTASRAENERVAGDLEKTKQYFATTNQKHKELIVSIMRENKKEREARERELEEQILMKNCIIQDLEARLSHSRSVENEQFGSFERHNNGGSSRFTLRVEELALQLRQIRESEMEVHSEIGRISKSLRVAEEA